MISKLLELEIQKALGCETETEPAPAPKGIQCHIGKEVIVRTYSAGVWFGKLTEKSGNEVTLDQARRMWRWQCRESISLSGVARHGIEQRESKIAGPVDGVWLEAIEILPVVGKAAVSLRDAPEVEAD